MEGIALETRSETDRIALRGVRVHARLAALGQKTTVEQTFVNLEDRAVEALYTFPLPEGAAVCQFEVMTDDRVLTGQVEEAEKAENVYDEMVSRGHGAFLLERHRPDVFTINVGNLKPKQAVTVRLTYVAELDVADSSIRLAFPTTVAPRYVTTTGMDPLQALIEGEQVNPPHVFHVPYGLSFDLEIDLALPVSAVESPSHAIRVTLDQEGRGSVCLEGGVTELDRDIVLQIALGREPAPTAQAGKGPGGNTFVAVTLQPHFDELDDAPAGVSNVFFLLDCSGSMDGDSIEQARRALELCLRSLSHGDRFNICRFGSTFEIMNAEPFVYSEKTLDMAVRYVRSATANLGGTELHAPLKAVLEAGPSAAQSCQVILLTDGQVGNEKVLIDLARQHGRSHRIFTFGIGHACSTHLVKSLARVTGGAAEFVVAGERIEDKVLRTFSRLCSPMATDVAVDWGGAEVIATSPDVPPLFEGDSLTIFGRVIGKAPWDCTVKVSMPAGPMEWRVSIPESTSEDGTIATLWARRRIQYLEDVCGDEPAHSRANRRPNKELVQLSKEFCILCSQTSFIALEHRSAAERNDGQPAFRRVPVQLPHRWHGLSSSDLHADTVACMCCIDFDASALDESPGETPHLQRRRSMDLASIRKTVGAHGMPPDAANVAFRERACLLRRIPQMLKYLMRGETPPQPESREQGGDDTLFEILGAQQADGSFERNESLDRIFGQIDAARLQALRDRVPALVGTPVDPRVTDTLLTLVVLRAEYPDGGPLWLRAHRKAVDYIMKQLGRPRSDVVKWLASLENVLMRPVPKA